ncbi:MAG: hypothetical protein WC755_08815 [Candidatus Woesearchaeota archaeon]|jgi:hypothetical protein
MNLDDINTAQDKFHAQVNMKGQLTLNGVPIEDTEHGVLSSLILPGFTEGEILIVQGHSHTGFNSEDCHASPEDGCKCTDCESLPPHEE